MNDALRDYVNKWLTIADHDLLNAQMVVEHNPLILDTACFHCQQAVEKNLKAYLVYKGVATERTHNLHYLLEECAKLDHDFAAIDVKDLNDFGVEIRYPDNFIMPVLDETKEYLQIARQVKELVLKKMEL